MAIYKCKGGECKGEVDFGVEEVEKKSHKWLKKGRRVGMLLAVKDKPVECPVCGVSYYEWELK